MRAPLADLAIGDRRGRTPALALLEAARWPNACIASLGVVVGAQWAGATEIANVATVAAGGAAITMAANLWNDVADIDIDRLAHPNRPLVLGELASASGRRAAGLLAAVGVACCALASWPIAIGAALVAGLAWMYSPWLKRLGWLGNLTVALVASLPFLFGAWAVGRPLVGVPLVLLAVPLHLAREIAKDINDVQGDAGIRRTLPLVRGDGAARAAILVSLILFAVAAAVVFRGRPHAAVGATPAFVLAAVAGVNVLRRGRRAPSILKAAMVCALAALILART
jgi:geranylgeranylglycerol-phosphate geranylgeranyltransferase